MAENGRSRGPSGPKGTPTQIQKHRTKIQDEEDRFEKMWEDLDNSDEDGADIDPDKFLREMDILDRLNPVPDFDLKPWEEVRKEFDSLPNHPDSADQQSSASAFEKRPKRRRPVKRSFRAAIFLVLLVGMLAIASACGVLDRILQAFGVDLEEIFSFEVFQTLRVDDPEPEDTEIGKYASLEDVLEDYGVITTYSNLEVPTPFSFYGVQDIEYAHATKFVTTYTYEEDEIMFTIWHYHDSTSLELQAAEKLPLDADRYIRHGIDYYFLGNSGMPNVTWIAGTEMYSLIGNVSQEQLKQMIDSIN